MEEWEGVEVATVEVVEVGETRVMEWPLLKDQTVGGCMEGVVPVLQNIHLLLIRTIILTIIIITIIKDSITLNTIPMEGVDHPSRTVECWVITQEEFAHKWVSIKILTVHQTQKYVLKFNKSVFKFKSYQWRLLLLVIIAIIHNSYYWCLQMCGGCHGPIMERYLLQSLDRFWHHNCLKCQACSVLLADMGSSCYFRDGMVLCKHDYVK